MHDAPHVFTIDAGQDFLATLVRGIVARYPADGPLAQTDVTVLLPNRRAVRALRGVWLQESAGRATLLPRLYTLGDVDEDALFFANIGAELTALPPAIPTLRRTLLLARFVQTLWGGDISAAGAYRLAGELGALIDTLHTQNLPLDALASIVPDDFADHWGVTLNFLHSVIRDHWPAVLADMGLMDASLRRRLLMEQLANTWQKNPPQNPVIAAGSTGSQAMTAQLLRVVSRLPQGAVVLSGLDMHLSEDAWNEVNSSHPQTVLKDLIGHIGVLRQDVAPWHTPPSATESERSRTTSAVLCPPEQVAAWQGQIYSADHLSVVEAETTEEQARVIALVLRDTASTPDKTAVVVTPDRALAKRVQQFLARWHITIDDSASVPLSDTNVGRYLLATAQLLRRPAQPAALITALQIIAPDYELDRTLRDPMQAIPYNRFPMLSGSEPDNLSACITQHIELAESLAGGADAVWHGTAGEQASVLFSAILDAADLAGAYTARDYPDFLRAVMQDVSVRDNDDASHPNIQILGQMEARFARADRLILAGLNEGVWPQGAFVSPWMSRPMLVAAGFEDPEQRIALSAHDFAQTASASEVIITYAHRIEGAPALPSRWVERLAALVATQKCGETPWQRGSVWLALARHIDHDAPVVPSAPRPNPAPPVSVRPKRLSVTRMADLITDPYTIYARSILRLYKMERLGQNTTVAQRGTLMHAALEKFVQQFPSGTLPDNAIAVLRDVIKSEFARIDNAELNQIDAPRFALWAEAIIDWENARRPEITHILAEAKGVAELNIAGEKFALEGRADRIEVCEDSTIHIVDYKTGTEPTPKQIKSHLSPQNTLLGLIAKHGGFPALAKGTVLSSQTYLKIGGTAAIRERTVEDSAELVDAIEEIVSALVVLFRRQEYGYICHPATIGLPRYYDYAHLSRMAEWLGGA